MNGLTQLQRHTTLCEVAAYFYLEICVGDHSGIVSFIFKL
jgi:hypothetical protein